jgi:hypothetical protein
MERNILELSDFSDSDFSDIDLDIDVMDDIDNRETKRTKRDKRNKKINSISRVVDFLKPTLTFVVAVLYLVYCPHGLPPLYDS